MAVSLIPLFIKIFLSTESFDNLTYNSIEEAAYQKNIMNLNSKN